MSKSVPVKFCATALTWTDSSEQTYTVPSTAKWVMFIPTTKNVVLRQTTSVTTTTFTMVAGLTYLFACEGIAGEAFLFYGENTGRLEIMYGITDWTGTY